MKFGEIRPGMRAWGQFIACSKYSLDAKKLVNELRRKLCENWQCEFIAVRKEKRRDVVGGIRYHVYQITFPMDVKPLKGDLTIKTIMGCLNEIELGVEKALRIKKLAEMVG